MAGPDHHLHRVERPEDAVLGFKLGADDFVRKPFSSDELEARIEAALRRPALRRSASAAANDDERRRRRWRSIGLAAA